MEKRIISSIVMILIIVPILLAGGEVFSLAVALLAILALKEFLDLKKSHHIIPSALILYSVIVLIFLVFYEYRGNFASYGMSHRLLIIILIGYLLPTLFISKNEYETKDAFYLFAIVVFLGLAFHSLLIIRADNIYLLGYLILIPVITDTFAYCVGSMIGKRKIAPSISPSKTMAGFVSGCICASVLGTTYYYFLVSSKNFLSIFALSFGLSIIGQIGDLIFSKIKRENDIKDFSKLIPGHGGVLDRIDSFLFVLLVYFVFFKVI